MENWLQNLLLKWRSEGVKLNPPASVAEIEHVELILDFKFPGIFKDYAHVSDSAIAKTFKELIEIINSKPAIAY